MSKETDKHEEADLQSYLVNWLQIATACPRIYRAFMRQLSDADSIHAHTSRLIKASAMGEVDCNGVFDDERFANQGIHLCYNLFLIFSGAFERFPSLANNTALELMRMRPLPSKQELLDADAKMTADAIHIQRNMPEEQDLRWVVSNRLLCDRLAGRLGFVIPWRYTDGFDEASSRLMVVGEQCKEVHIGVVLSFAYHFTSLGLTNVSKPKYQKFMVEHFLSTCNACGSPSPHDYRGAIEGLHESIWMSMTFEDLEFMDQYTYGVSEQIFIRSQIDLARSKLTTLPKCGDVSDLPENYVDEANFDDDVVHGLREASALLAMADQQGADVSGVVSECEEPIQEFLGESIQSYRVHFREHGYPVNEPQRSFIEAAGLPCAKHIAPPAWENELCDVSRLELIAANYTFDAWSNFEPSIRTPELPAHWSPVLGGYARALEAELWFGVFQPNLIGMSAALEPNQAQKVKALAQSKNDKDRYVARYIHNYRKTPQTARPLSLGQMATILSMPNDRKQSEDSWWLISVLQHRIGWPLMHSSNANTIKRFVPYRNMSAHPKRVGRQQALLGKRVATDLLEVMAGLDR